MTEAQTQVKAPPVQVQQAAAAAEEIQKQLLGEPPAGEPSVEDLLSAAEAPSPERQTPPEEPAAEPTEGKPREDWKQKYHVLQGKYDAEVPRLHNDLKDLQGQVQELLSTPTPEPEAPVVEGTAPGHKYVKEDELTDYGPEFLDMVGRRAREVAEAEFTPMVTELREQVSTLNAQLASTGQRVQNTEQETFYSKLDKTVENWREVNKDSKFLEWLGTVIPETEGITRSEMLMKSFNAANVDGVAAVFNNYSKSVGGQENAPPLETPEEVPAGEAPTLELQNLVAPVAGQGTPQGAPANESSQKIWTQAEIATFYREVKDGAYRANPKDKDLIEKHIVLAAKEGRVR